jgi:SurA N-terminal domain
MKTRTMNTAVMMVMLIASLVLFACRKTEPTSAKVSPEAHQNEMVKKSFEESKQVIAAKVNGEAITMFSVLREMNSIAPQYLKPGQPSTPEINAKIRKDALNTLITQELAVQEAIKRGLKVTPETIDNEIRKIKTGKGSEAGYQEYLGNNGLTENDLRKMIEQDTLFEMIAAQEIDAKITVTDAALRERYKKEKAGLKDSSHRNMSFEEAKGMLELKVRAEAGDRRMREWEKELRKNARIELLDQGQKQG